MGTKLIFTGLTLIMALQHWVPQAEIVGAVIMIIGLILMWLDR